jgi:hypothetical protein
VSKSRTQVSFESENVGWAFWENHAMPTIQTQRNCVEEKKAKAHEGGGDALKGRCSIIHKTLVRPGRFLRVLSPDIDSLLKFDTNCYSLPRGKSPSVRSSTRAFFRLEFIAPFPQAPRSPLNPHQSGRHWPG